jgi:hypothetical protein
VTARARSLVAATHADVVVCDVGALVDPDLAAVDVCARLQLEAKRAGRRVQVRSACDGLRRLIELAGLCDLLLGRADLCVEEEREPE